MSAADILLLLLIAAALAGAVLLIRKKRLLSSCEGGCASCPRAAECGKREETDKQENR